MIGKGFGNLPKHLDSTEVTDSTDFEVILAGGMAHNGFITAAFGFGIPFMVALTLALCLRFFFQVRMALMTDKHDKELRDMHALLASAYPAYAIGIYTAFDMSSLGLWVYVGLGFILEQLFCPGLHTVHGAAHGSLHVSEPVLGRNFPLGCCAPRTSGGYLMTKKISLMSWGLLAKKNKVAEKKQNVMTMPIARIHGLAL